MGSNIREVAARAGVSRATVSRVFAQPEVVVDGTRRRVLDAARELGWAPNQTAQSLARGRTGNLGLLIPDVSNPAFGAPIKEVQTFVRERGYSLFIAAGDGSTEDERALVHAVAAKVDGLVLVAPRMSPQQLADVRQISPLTLVNRVAPGIPSTVIPGRDGMTALVEHLAEMGYDRLMYLEGPGFSPSNAHRLDAFREATQNSGIDGITLGPFEPEYLAAGARAVDEVLRRQPKAVIGFNDLLAVGLISQLQRRGIQPGRDIGVAGFDGSWLCDSTTPSLTSVHLPFSHAIRSAVLDVIDLIEDREAVTLRELPSRLVVAGSTNPAPSPVHAMPGRTGAAQTGDLAS
jgi:DNA-binding LacI/PurR family transcriptional regulator